EEGRPAAGLVGGGDGEEVGAAARREQAEGEGAVADVEGAVLGRQGPFGAPDGHQRYLWPGQRSGTWGMTSRARRAVLWNTRSFGIEPIWSSTMRWPTRRLLMHSVSCWRTVAGPPAIT